MTPYNVYFFLLFNWKILLFVLLFKIPKKFRSTEISNELHRLMIVSHRGDDGDIVKFRNFEKSRYFRHFEFLKKSNFLKLHLALRCVYFAHPDSTISSWSPRCWTRFVFHCGVTRLTAGTNFHRSALFIFHRTKTEAKYFQFRWAWNRGPPFDTACK